MDRPGGRPRFGSQRFLNLCCSLMRYILTIAELIPRGQKKFNFWGVNSIQFIYHVFTASSPSLCSASGCPIANRNKMRVLESGGTLEQHKAAVISATSLKFDSVNCPTPGSCVVLFIVTRTIWRRWVVPSGLTSEIPVCALQVVPRQGRRR